MSNIQDDCNLSHPPTWRTLHLALLLLALLLLPRCLWLGSTPLLLLLLLLLFLLPLLHLLLLPLLRCRLSLHGAEIRDGSPLPHATSGGSSGLWEGVDVLNFAFPLALWLRGEEAGGRRSGAVARAGRCCCSIGCRGKSGMGCIERGSLRSAKRCRDAGLCCWNFTWIDQEFDD